MPEIRPDREAMRAKDERVEGIRQSLIEHARECGTAMIPCCDVAVGLDQAFLLRELDRLRHTVGECSCSRESACAWLQVVARESVRKR